MKKVVLVGVGKKSLILDILKKNNENNKHKLEKVLKQESKNKLMLEAKNLIETDEKVFVEQK